MTIVAEIIYHRQRFQINSPQPRFRCTVYVHELGSWRELQ